jgi:hypothetical protein
MVPQRVLQIVPRFKQLAEKAVQPQDLLVPETLASCS